MDERTPSTPEGEKEITKEEAVSAYRSFVERGIKNPDDLDRDDPEVQAADKLFFSWKNQLVQDSESNEESEYGANLSITMFYVDAGFTDPEYLDEILNDSLVQDAEDVEERDDYPEKAGTLELIAAAEEKVRALIEEQKEGRKEE